MLEIIVCDDDSFTLKILSRLVSQAISESGSSAQIVCSVSSGQELLQFLHGNPGHYLYFLDYDMGKSQLNGIDLVRRIYRSDPDGKIVFVTSHSDKGMEILRSGIRPFGFIEKNPDSRHMIREYIRCLRLASEKDGASFPEPCIELPLGIGETIRLTLTEITYVDSVKTVAHSVCYHTFDGSEITVRDTLEHVHKLLGKDFIRCHRSVLVNRKYVVSLKNGMVYLSNSSSVSCAFSKRKALAELLQEPLKGQNAE